MATERDVNQARKVARSSEFQSAGKKRKSPFAGNRAGNIDRSGAPVPQLGAVNPAQPNTEISYNQAAKDAFAGGGQRSQGGVGGAGGTAGADASGVGVNTAPNPLDDAAAVGRPLGKAAHDFKKFMTTPHPVNSPTTAPTPGPTAAPATAPAAIQLGAPGVSAEFEAAYDDPNDITSQGIKQAGGAVEETYDADYDGASLANKRLGNFEVQEGEGRNVLYKDDAGNLLSGQRPASGGNGGGGSFSVLGGPGGVAGSDDPVENQKAIDANVAAYDRQTAALKANRDLRTELQDGARNPRVGGGTVQPAISQYEQELNARNARVGSNRYTGNAPRRIAAQAAADNAATNARKAAQGDATTRRGQDIAASTAQDRIDADIFGDQLSAEASSDERNRKIGESQRDFAQREQRLALDDRKARVTESEGFNKLSVTQQKNIGTAINNATKLANEGASDTAFRQLVNTAGYKVASSIFPDEERAYLESQTQE